MFLSVVVFEILLSVFVNSSKKDGIVIVFIQGFFLCLSVVTKTLGYSPFLFQYLFQSFSIHPPEKMIEPKFNYHISGEKYEFIHAIHCHLF